MKKHANIPIFIPHLGCPNTCVFCNQRTISGVSEFRPEGVRDEIERALATVEDGTECEIAFFGGSFTGIDRTLMVSLLEIAYSYIKKGLVKSVRCSTRPDYISDEILDILEEHGVKTVELGLQSVSDNVLLKTKRGHSYEDEKRAVALIKKRGIDLVGQMMIGLPQSTLEDELRTADFIISSGAVAARIYPTVVFRDTELCEMSMRGEYTPITNEEAVIRSAEVYERFFDAGVKVIRIGLHASENLSDRAKFYAGASHSALGELVLGEFYYKKIKKAIIAADIPRGAKINIKIPRGATSRAVGQKKRNKLRLIGDFSLGSVKFTEDASLCEGNVSICLEGR